MSTYPRLQLLKDQIHTYMIVARWRWRVGSRWKFLMWSERISAAKKVVTDKAFMYIPYVQCMYGRYMCVWIVSGSEKERCRKMKSEHFLKNDEKEEVKVVPVASWTEAKAVFFYRMYLWPLWNEKAKLSSSVELRRKKCYTHILVQHKFRTTVAQMKDMQKSTTMGLGLKSIT